MVPILSVRIGVRPRPSRRPFGPPQGEGECLRYYLVEPVLGGLADMLDAEHLRRAVAADLGALLLAFVVREWPGEDSRPCDHQLVGLLQIPARTRIGLACAFPEQAIRVATSDRVMANADRRRTDWTGIFFTPSRTTATKLQGLLRRNNCFHPAPQPG